MMRICLMVLRCLFYEPFWFYRLYQWGKSDKHSEQEKFAFLQKLTKKVNKAGRVTIKAYGIENLPDKQGYIMFPNHQGLYDVLAFLETSPNPFSAVIKKEAASWPLVKQIYIFLRMLKLDRNDPKDGVRVIAEMAKQVQEGRNFIIFAEGTRNQNGNQMGEMKAGSFKSAMKAKCPIVPVAIIDCYKPFDTNSIKRVTVQLHYMKPLYYEEYQHLKSREIAAEVQQRIEEKIAELAPDAKE